MTAPGRLVAFAATTDMSRAAAFYRDTLGLAVTESSPFATVFDGGGTQLRVTAVAEKASARYTVLGWEVDDLDASAAALRNRGVTFARYDGMEQDEVGAWTAPDGTRVAWFEDPDGNILSLSQHS